MECGPYTTKAETEEDIRGLLRSRREHPELNDPWYGYDYRAENLVQAGPSGQLVPRERRFSKIYELEKECYDSKGRPIPYKAKPPKPAEKPVAVKAVETGVRANAIVEPFEYMIQKILPREYNGELRKLPKETNQAFEARIRKAFPDWDRAPRKDELKLTRPVVLPPPVKKKLVLPPLAKPGSLAQALFDSMED